jgi:hypothetical protein
MTRGTVLSLWMGLAAVSALSGLTTALVPSRALAAVDSREMQAREAFGAGRYQEALDLFVKLYAEKLHPNYLRNIGRCYQNLGDPDKAISSFREYLRKAKGVRPDERAEVEGYIKEMEDLKKQRAQAAAPPPVEPLPSARTPAATTPPAAVTAPATPPPSLTLHDSPPPPAQEESHPVYTKWWFWTIIGVVIAGGVAGAAAAGVFTKTNDAPCGAMNCGG